MRRKRRDGSLAESLAPLLIGVLLSAGIFGSASSAVAQGSSPAPSAAVSSEGQQIFESQCTGCHTIGGGPMTGPDLEGVGDRQTSDWLATWIADPQAVVDSGDAHATQMVDQYGSVMPNMGLSSEQVSAVVDYLGGTSGGTGSSPSSQSPSPVPQGDPLIGKELFIGDVRFQNGGPACIACHSAGGIGSLGGGKLGPNLSTTFQKSGPAGTRAVLTSLPFPTMKAVWSDHPITPQEQENLVAFLQTSLAQRSASAVDDLVAVVLQFAGLLFLLTALLFLRRLTSVRRAMVKRAVKRT